MSEDQAAALERRRLFKNTHECLVDGTKRCVQSVFVPDMRVVTLASDLLVDPADSEMATFSIAVRQGGYGKVFLISLHGTGIAVEEQGQQRINFVLESDALA